MKSNKSREKLRNLTIFCNIICGMDVIIDETSSKILCYASSHLQHDAIFFHLLVNALSHDVVNKKLHSKIIGGVLH